MITIPDGQAVGPTGNTGIWVPGAVLVGGGTSSPPITGPIDLTAPTLDPRVTFSGPAHFHWSETGVMLESAANTWPLEYQNGIAVGRHEPEPQATNYQLMSRGDVAVSAPDVGPWISLGLTLSAGIGPDGGDIGMTTTDCDLYAIYDATAGAFIVPQTKPPALDEWSRIVVPFSVGVESQIRTYSARESATKYLYGLCEPIPSGDCVVSLYRRENTELLTGLVQVETGTLATSPIITADAVSTRPASSVTINTGSASTITVRYSNGESDTYSTPGDSFTLPAAQRNWSERYITEIEMTQ